jgi:hypothetical protein
MRRLPAGRTSGRVVLRLAFSSGRGKEKQMIELTPVTIIAAIVIGVVIAVIFVINIRSELK